MLPSAMRELSYSTLRFGLYRPIKVAMPWFLLIPSDSFNASIVFATRKDLLASWTQQDGVLKLSDIAPGNITQGWIWIYNA